MLAEMFDRKYTSDEFLAMTDLEGRYELINGEIYDMSPAPVIRHQLISLKLAKTIDNYVEKNNGSCIVLEAPTDVKLDDENTVQPDIFVVCDPDKIDEKRCNGAPDWIIEILSPSSVDHDQREKLNIYTNAGVREYWIVDPMNDRVFVYPIVDRKLTSTGLFTFDDEIPAGIYKDAPEPLTICINRLLRR